MKDFTIQYLDEDGSLKVANIKAHSKEEAIEKFNKAASKMDEKVVLHRTGWKKWAEYFCDHNGHHYEIWKETGNECWSVMMDGELKDGSYWLKDIRGSIAAGDYED